MLPGDRIRKYREDQGLTQKIFCAKIGVAQGYLAEIESGKKGPSKKFLKKVQDVFGLESDYVLYGGVSSGWKNISKKLSDAGLEQAFIDEIHAHFIYAAISSAEDRHIVLRKAQERDLKRKEQKIPGSSPARKLRDLIKWAREILKSESDYGHALAANIVAFHDALSAEENNLQQKDRIEKLEGRLNALEKVISNRDELPSSVEGSALEVEDKIH